MKSDWLDQLAADHAPPPASWFPPAPGWWLAALFAIAAIAALVFWLRRPSRRLRLAATRELARIERTESGDRALAVSLENFLRRYAVARHGREAVSRLSGDAWLAFLADHGGAGFAGDPGRQLLRAAYGGSLVPARDAWLTGARGFVKGRRTRRGSVDAKAGAAR